MSCLLHFSAENKLQGSLAAISEGTPVIGADKKFIVPQTLQSHTGPMNYRTEMVPIT
jgi:hypothetical protein